MDSLFQLATVFTFTPDDLNANQQGKLSQRQRALLRDLTATGVSVVAFGVMLAIVVACGGAGFITISLNSQQPPWMMLAFGVIAVLFLSLAWTWDTVASRIDARRGIVTVTAGIPTFSASQSKGYVEAKRHYLRVGRRKFRISDRQHDALRAVLADIGRETTFHAYSTPLTRRLMSLAVAPSASDEWR